MTAEQAANLVAEEIKKQGKFNIGNVLDAVIGVAVANKDELQELLNDLLKKKGVLSEQDEELVNEMIRQQEAEKKKRQQIRTKNTIVIVSVIAAVSAAIYFAIKKK